MTDANLTSLPRRQFLQQAVAVGTGVALPQMAWAQGSDGPEKSTVRLSFIGVTDCAVAVMASELDTGKKYGLKIEIVKEAGPVPQRDRLLSGEVDAVGTGLYGMFEALQIGAGEIKADVAILMGMTRNGQGLTISNQLLEKGVRDGASLAKLIQTERREYRVAHTYPSGCHSLWINYWLAAHGINPIADVKTMAIPAPQMVANMRIGNMDACCSAEPVSARAIMERVGYTVAASQMIWPDHPEKVLVVKADFAQRYPKTCAALVAALLDAAKYSDAEVNRGKVAKVISDKAYVNAPLDSIEPRLLGNYNNGIGKSWRDGKRLKFFDDGRVSQPLVSSSLWFLTQQKRWKMIDATPVQMLETAKKMVRTDIYAAGAAKAGVAVHQGDGEKATLMDGVVWDPAKFDTYADSFKIKA